MAIQFRCTQCNKLLRTGEDLAGRQVKCPACGSVLTIPQQDAGQGSPSSPDQELFFSPEAPAAVNPYAASQTVQPQAALGGGVVTARAAAILRQHPPPTGSCDEWPLSDRHLAELKRTEQFRRRIRQASLATRFAFWIDVIYLVIFAFAFWTVADRMRVVPLGMVIMLMVMLGLAVLFWVAQGATLRCQRWAPLVVGILFTLLVVLMLFALIAALSEPPRMPQELMFRMIGGFFMLALTTLVTVLNYRGFAAITSYLNQPVWCQEALINSRL